MPQVIDKIENTYKERKLKRPSKFMKGITYNF